MSTGIALETERLFLREVAVDDVTDRYVGWLNDDEVTRYLEGRFSDNSTESLKAYVRDQSADSSVVFVAIVEKPDRLIGTTKIGPIDHNHMRADIGIMIGERDTWGQGYATETIRALSTFAFDRLGLVRLTAGAYAVNTASIKAFKRAGFRVEGVLRGEARLDNGRVDIVQLGLLAPSRAQDLIIAGDGADTSTPGHPRVAVRSEPTQLFDAAYTGETDQRPQPSPSEQVPHDSGRVSEVFEAALGHAGLHAALRSADAAGWDEAWQSLPYQPVAYSSTMLDYQHAYLKGDGWSLDDLSLVIRNGGQVCAMWPLLVGGPHGEQRLTSSGGPVFAPAFSRGTSDRTRRNLSARAVEFVLRLCSDLHLAPPRLTQHVLVDPDDAPGATRWHQQLMASGAQPAVRHEMLVDLSRPLADIRASFRKSYRPLINAGLRNWAWQLLDDTNPSPAVWDEFRQLHRTAARRVTRSDETWARQLAMIEGADAFFVGVRDPSHNRLVGGGFFQLTRDECLYAVAANDRSLTDRPLGHVVQQVAIEFMKSRGLRWYRLGEHPYAQDLPRPSEKELTIADFKRGFATHLVCRHEFELPLPAE